MGDFVPKSDVDLQVWTSTFTTYLAANLAKFGLVAADVAALNAAEPEFNTARNDTNAARATYRGEVSNKKVKRGTLVDEIRTVAARVQSCPATTNQDRDALGIPRRGETAPVPQDVELLADRPLAGINIAQIGRHTLRIQNDNQGVVSLGKPEGVKAVEVWVKVGEPPVDTDVPELVMRYVNMSTRNTVSVPFPPGDGNKQAHYKLRWVYSSGLKGGWSETQSATIAA